MSAAQGVTVVAYLGDEPAAARAFCESLAALSAQPRHEVVLIADSAPRLEPVLAALDGDVTVLRTGRHLGAAAALASAGERARGRKVVLVARPIVFGPSWLAALLAPLDEDTVLAAVPPGARSTLADSPAVALDAATYAALASAFEVDDDLVIAELLLRVAAKGRVAVADARAASFPAPRSLLRAAVGGEPELSVVIPTLDAASERAQRCLRAVQRTLEQPHEIVVVDNGAPAQGFSAPVNAGLRAARGQYVVVINDDVEPLPGWWPPLREALDNGATVVFPDTVGGFRRADFAAWCFALKRATVEELAVAPGEFFDPELRVWYQDADLLLRLAACGRPPRLVPAARVRHGLSETVESDDPELSAWVRARRELDRAHFERKHPGVVLRPFTIARNHGDG